MRQHFNRVLAKIFEASDRFIIVLGTGLVLLEISFSKYFLVTEILLTMPTFDNLFLRFFCVVNGSWNFPVAILLAIFTFTTNTLQKRTKKTREQNHEDLNSNALIHTRCHSDRKIMRRTLFQPNKRIRSRFKKRIFYRK